MRLRSVKGEDNTQYEWLARLPKGPQMICMACGGCEHVGLIYSKQTSESSYVLMAEWRHEPKPCWTEPKWQLIPEGSEQLNETHLLGRKVH